MPETPNQPSTEQTTTPVRPQSSPSQAAQSEPTQSTPSSLAPNQKIVHSKASTILVMAGVFLLGVMIILWAWQIGPFHTALEKTDNSYIKAQTTILSSQINGYIDHVYVKDFDQVQRGQPIMTVSTANYNQQLVQSEAAVTQAKTNVDNQQQLIAQREADLAAARARVEQTQAQYTLSTQQLQRYQQLANTGAVSQNEVQISQAAQANNKAQLEQAEAALEATRQALKTAQVAQTGLQAQVKSSEAQVRQAQTTQNYSAINAPFAGRLGQLNVHLGQYVATGTQLVYIVPQQTWVIANFKETQMNRIRVGQRAWFTVDALDHEKFTGVVERISPATGSEFSVIKTDNATGNFTKVVQRIAVRIAIDPHQPDLQRLSPGMSLETTVDTASHS